MARNLRDLQLGAAIPGGSAPSVSLNPLWLDPVRLQRGQRFFEKHAVSIALSMHCSLVVGFTIENLIEALQYTEMTDTAEKSLRRYLKTFYYVLQWHTGDMWNPQSRAYDSLQTVRMMHRKVAEDLTISRPGRLHVSQYDMALVQCGFMGAIIMYPESFGIKCSLGELQDFIYLWKCIGHLLGMDPRYNLCESEDYFHTFTLCKQIEQKVLLPAMASPPNGFDITATAYCDGINQLMRAPVYTKEAIMTFVYSVMEVDGIRMPGWRDRLRYYCYWTFVLLLRWCPYFEYGLNKLLLSGFFKFEKIMIQKETEILHH